VGISLQPENSEQYFVDAVRHLEYYTGPLDTVVDIGAHIGSLSLMAADRGAKQIVAVEPMSENFKNLIANINDNYFLDVITPINAMIVADASWERKLYCPMGAGGCCGMIVNQAGSFEIPPLIAFKYFLSEFKHIDYLKIDIEGGEFEIFDQSQELEQLLMRVRFLDLEIHKTEAYAPDYSTITKYSHSDKAGDELVKYLRDIGFRGDAHPEVVRKHGRYAFGSENFNFLWR
jgi:FkbM family methyltransferase